MTLTPEEYERDLATAKENGPSAEELERLVKRDADILATGIFFKPNDNLLEEMVTRARALGLQKLP